MSSDRRPERVVVVGAGLAGLRTVEQLRQAGHQGSISLLGAEPHAPYDRPPLSKQVLSGSWAPERTGLAGREKLDELDVRLHLGEPAVGLEDGAVQLADGTRCAADAIVIATGVTARRLHGQPDKAHTLRTVEDSLLLRDALSSARSLLVVGGGFVGAEVASCALDQGLDVTVLEALANPFAKVLGNTVAELCGRAFRESGADLRSATQVHSFRDGLSVQLAGNEIVAADAIVVASGTVPNVHWLDGGSLGRHLDTSDGVACDHTGRVVGASGLWAVGDVASWDDPVTGRRCRREHWMNANDQAAIVARDIVGAPQAAVSVPYFWSDQFGLKIQLVGRPESADTVLELHGDGFQGGTVRGTVAGYFADDRLVGVVAFSAARQISTYRSLVTRGARRAELPNTSTSTRLGRV